MIKDRLFLYLLVFLVITNAITGVLYFKEKAKVYVEKHETDTVNINDLKNNIAQQNLFIQNQVTLANQVQKSRDEIAQIDAKHKEEINEINTRYTNAIRDADRMRNDIRSLNNQLSQRSRATVEQYASTAADNLAECSATTVELEKLAYGYYAELQSVRDKYEQAVKLTNPESKK